MCRLTLTDTLVRCITAIGVLGALNAANHTLMRRIAGPAVSPASV
jgi:hypothetical protein